MKTSKEIEVWVTDDFRDNTVLYRQTSINMKATQDFPVRAKLIIEVEPKKISLTEAEFDEVVKSIDKNRLYHWYPEHTQALKEKLFSKSEG